MVLLPIKDGRGARTGEEQPQSTITRAHWAQRMISRSKLKDGMMLHLNFLFLRRQIKGMGDNTVDL